FLIAGAKEAAMLGGYALPVWAGGAPEEMPDAGTADDASDDAGAPPAGATAPASATTTTTSGCSVSVGTFSSSRDGATTFAVLFGVVLLAASRRRRSIHV